jgi:hypothetical protein
MDGGLQVKILKRVCRMVFELHCRKFVSLGTEARKSATMKLASSLSLNKTGSIAEELGSVRFFHST